MASWVAAVTDGFSRPDLDVGDRVLIVVTGEGRLYAMDVEEVSPEDRKFLSTVAQLYTEKNVYWLFEVSWNCHGQAFLAFRREERGVKTEYKLRPLLQLKQIGLGYKLLFTDTPRAGEWPAENPWMKPPPDAGSGQAWASAG
jgi:hypothetical protein